MSPDMLDKLISEVFGNKTECAKRVGESITGRNTFCRTNLSKYTNPDLRRNLPDDLREFFMDSLDQKIKDLASIRNMLQ